MKYSRIICETKEESCNDINYNDSIVDFIVDCCLNFYGLEEENDGIDIDDDDENRVYIGRITGYLILCRVMEQLLEDAYTVCDDHSARLEMIFSILSNQNTAYIEDDIFYITETDLNGDELKAVMNKLPYSILKSYHAYPNIICYYPAPLPYEEEKPLEKQVKEGIAAIVTKDIIQQNMPSLLNNKTDNNKESKPSIQLNLDREQQNYILGRWNSYNTYPESAKNKKEFRKFEKTGFKEYQNTRLLVRYF